MYEQVTYTVYMPLLNMSEHVPGYSHLNILLFLSFNMHNPLRVKSICLEAHLHFMQRGNTSGTVQYIFIYTVLETLPFFDMLKRH